MALGPGSHPQCARVRASHDRSTPMYVGESEGHDIGTQSPTPLHTARDCLPRSVGWQAIQGFWSPTGEGTHLLAEMPPSGFGAQVRCHLGMCPLRANVRGWGPQQLLGISTEYIVTQ